jgi:hypothetical protein
LFLFLKTMVPVVLKLNRMPQIWLIKGASTNSASGEHTLKWRFKRMMRANTPYPKAVLTPPTARKRRNCIDQSFRMRLTVSDQSRRTSSTTFRGEIDALLLNHQRPMPNLGVYGPDVLTHDAQKEQLDSPDEEQAHNQWC